MQSDFVRSGGVDEWLGLLEYVGSAAVLWFGLVLWRTRGASQSAGTDAFFLLVSILTVVFGILMTLIAGNAVVGFFGSTP